MKPSQKATLFTETFFKQEINHSTLIANSGSTRKYFRIQVEANSYILTENNFVEENQCFFYLAKIFYQNTLKVPKLIAVDTTHTIYIQEDIGDESLLNYKMRNENSLVTKEMYAKSILQLAKLQTSIKGKIDYTKCYDFQEFNEKVVYNDFFYFKDYFVERLNFPYQKNKFIADVEKIASQIGTLPNDYFLYRDFQSRNIFIKDYYPYFIDFQGGMKGFLCYDLVSLLWQAKAELPMAWKLELKELYFTEIRKTEPVSIEMLEKSYHLSLVLRFFQLMGAYGLRGLVERKKHFLESIELNINNLQFLLDENRLKDYSEIEKITQFICSQEGKSQIEELLK